MTQQALFTIANTSLPSTHTPEESHFSQQKLRNQVSEKEGGAKHNSAHAQKNPKKNIADTIG